MMVEGDHPAGSEGAGLGLADVVEQRGQAQHPIGAGLVDHRQRVGQDVLVAVDRVLFEGQPRQLGKELGRQAGADHEPEGHRGNRTMTNLSSSSWIRSAETIDEALVTGLDRLDQLLVRLQAVAGR